MSGKINIWLTLDDNERPVIGFEHIENSSAIHDKVLGLFIKRALVEGVKITLKSGTSKIEETSYCTRSSTYYIECK